MQTTGTSTPHADQDGPSIASEQIQMVARGAATNLLVGLLAAAGVAGGAVLGDAHPRHVVHAALWFGALAAGLLAGVRIAGRLQQRRADPAYLERAGGWFVQNNTFCGVLWGAASWILLPADAAGNEVFVLVGIAFVLTGGAAALAAYRPMAQAFTVSVTVVFVAGLVRFPDRFHLLYALAFAGLGVVTILASRNQERALHDQISFRREREHLVQLADQARREAELANQAKTVFLSAASHDLRQPLHALVQYMSYLKAHNQDAALALPISRGEHAVDTLRTLLDSMLDFTKIAAGTLKPVMTPTSMTGVLDRLEAQLLPLALDKGLQLVVNRSAACVTTDEVLLERILVNLSLNAIRYTRAGRVLVRCSHRRGYLRCQVFDTGIGIPATELQNIYEPFYQVANAARDRRKGLGMGLAIVRQLCDLMDYRIRVRSVLGKGSVFAIDVPLAAHAMTAVPECSAQASDLLRGKLVALMDNDVESLEATCQTLRSFGCRVLHAPSSEAMVARLRDSTCAPDLILADYRMEGETGLDAIRIITDSLRARFGDDLGVPAIVISGDTSQQVLLDVSDDGYAMLHKPVLPADLQRAMTAALGGD